MPLADSTSLQTFLEQHVQMLHRFQLEDRNKNGYCCIQDFVLRNGQKFEVIEAPLKHKRGTPRHCFQNCLEASIKYGLTYVEGFALGIIPVVHAWCVEPGSDKVIDITWEPGTGCEYFGIRFKTSYVAQCHSEAGYYGVIDNWRSNWRVLSDPPELWRYENGR